MLCARESPTGEGGEGRDQPMEKSDDERSGCGEEGTDWWLGAPRVSHRSSVGPGGGLGALADQKVFNFGVSAEGCDGRVVEVHLVVHPIAKDACKARVQPLS